MATTNPTALFFYGLSGAGKSFVGDATAAVLGWPSYHADDDLTDDMKQALAAHQPFNDAMRDRYFAVVAARIAERLSSSRGLIVTQGAYRRRHRDLLRSHIQEMSLVCVSAPDHLIVERIARRADGIGIASARALANDFDGPDDGDLVIVNDGDAAHAVALLRAHWPALFR